MRPSPETLAEMERHKECPLGGNCDQMPGCPPHCETHQCYMEFPCFPASALAYIRDLEQLTQKLRITISKAWDGEEIPLSLHAALEMTEDEANAWDDALAALDIPGGTDSHDPKED